MKRISARRRIPRVRPRPTRKRPVPRNAVRRVKSPQPPRAVELYFVAMLLRAAGRFARALRLILNADVVASFAKPETKTDARLDAPSGEPAKHRPVKVVQKVAKLMSDARKDVKAARD